MPLQNPFAPKTRLSKGVAACALALLVGCNNERTAERHESAGAPGATEYEKGPHGGRLLTEGRFQTEVTIYERGVPPQWRIYLYEDKKPLPPNAASLQIQLTRHGGRIDRFDFKPEQDYLVGDQVVEEPHSFDVDVTAQRGDKRHAWKYSQREGRVELSDEAVRTSAIEIESAGPAKMRSVLASLPGEIQLNGDRVTHVVPRMSGLIREIRKNQGDEVKKGEVIAILESRELAEAKREYFETAHELEFSRRAFEREEGLFKKNIASEAAYQDKEREFHGARLKHESARQQLEALGIPRKSFGSQTGAVDLTRYELRAPFDGVLVEKTVATGQAVKEHDDLFTLADLSSVWVSINVYPKDLNAVKVGQEVTVRSDVLDATATAKIVYVGSLVGEETRSAKARVVLADPERKWRAGMFVTVSIVQGEVDVPVAIKREGLQKFRDWDVVFVRAGNEFEARPLELGREDGEWVEVVKGLQPGERYATANSFILKADVGKSGASHDH